MRASNQHRPVSVRREPCRSVGVKNTQTVEERECDGPPCSAHSPVGLVDLPGDCHHVLGTGGPRHAHRHRHRQFGRPRPRRLCQSRPRRHQLRTQRHHFRSGLLHHPAAPGRRLRRHHHRRWISAGHARQHRGDRRKHHTRRRQARARRPAGCDHRVGRGQGDSGRQRQGDHRDQRQVHPGPAARGRRTAPVTTRSQLDRAGSQDRHQRRRRPRQHRDWRRPGRRMGSDRRRRLRHAGRAVRATVVDDAELPVGGSDHGVRGRHQRVQGGVRPRRRRRGQLRVALGDEPMARQGLRVHARRCVRLERFLQQGGGTGQADALAT
jgi:hypothetical protein